MAALREAGQALRRAQRKALSGGGGEDLRRATDDRRALIQSLADAGVAAIGARGGTHRDALAATFDAASVDDELGGRVQAGILEREAKPAAGFGAIEGFEILQGGGGADAEEPEDEDPAEIRRERTRDAREAAQRAAAAERAADKAHRRAEDLKEKAAAAVTAAREAESEAKRLTDEAKTERKRAERAAKAASS